MLHQLISHSPDLKSLWDEGYEIEIRDGHLLLHHIPYVSEGKAIEYGTLVTTLNLAGNKTHKPETHVSYFIGKVPCNKNGKIIAGILNSSRKQKLTASIEIDQIFSSKPREGYKDYFHKMSTYANIISAPAKSIDKTVTEKSQKVREPEEGESRFMYLDTNSTRAQISMVSDKLKNERVAIIGLGGTGSYILDLVAKTPVEVVHMYDMDLFLQHNSFRAPGAAGIDDLRSRQFKVEYFKALYSKMHRNIIAHPYHIDSSTIEELDGMTIVFLCIDDGDAKKDIVQWLLNKQIPLIDVGMGVNIVDDSLIGTVRVTSVTSNKNDHIAKRISFAKGDENDYAENIQIADLNALNGSLAVIKWKKLVGFYQDLENEHNSTYTVNVNMLLSEDIKT